MKQVKSLRAARKASEATKEVVDKVIENGKGNDKLSKATSVGKTIAGAGNFLTKYAPLIGLIATIGVVQIVNEIQGWRADMAERGQESLSASISKVLGILNVYKGRIENNKKAIAESKLADQRTRDRVYAIEKERNTVESKITEAKKQANDALYETRQNKTSLESKISDVKKQSNDALYETRQGKITIEGKVAEAKKQSNDALYETRQNKFSLDGKIQQINSEIARISSKASDGLQNSVNATILKLQTELATVRANLAGIKPATPVDIAAINTNAIAAARAIVTPLQSQIGGVQASVGVLTGQVNAATTLAGVAINGASNLAQGVASANATANQALNESRTREVPNLAPLQQQLDDKFNRFITDNNKALGIKDLQLSDLSKEFDRKNAEFVRLSNMTADQRFAAFQQQNNKDLKIRDLQLSDLSKEFDRKNADFVRLSTLTADQRFEEFQRENRASLGLIQADLKTTETDIQKIDTGLKEQEKVNATALPKLNQILSFLPLIPGRAAAAIRPDIPTLPQIENAAATGTCRTTQPGGCMAKALDNNAANINNNANANTGNILGAVNAAGQGADLALLGIINNKLGNQLPGGIGGKLSRFADWMHLDRVLNILIFGATIHNGLMLSSDIGQTFIGIINNVLTTIGLKKEDGSGFDIGSVVSGTVENLVKGVVGAENYTNLTTAWAKANRIYQATTNIFNALQGLSSTILTGLEMTMGKVGKVANALRKSGEVLENAYGWMNPQPKLNRITQGLESLQATASTVLAVTQVPLDVIASITELTNASTELTKAMKEDNKPENKGKEAPEPDKLKADELASKISSTISNILPEDLFNGAD
ncbi:hypothetical protein [Nostoc sp.]|uniref:hypothetical protein n=1 Tax=Nostoc sp. TaxID=1180 RepID=UPI00359371C1